MSYYPITLDKERNFRYGMKALSLLEKKFKKPIGEIDMNVLSIDEIATIFWAGLTHEDAELTIDKVMDLVDSYSTLGEVLPVMLEAMQGAFGSTIEFAERAENESKEKN